MTRRPGSRLPTHHTRALDSSEVAMMTRPRPSPRGADHRFLWSAGYEPRANEAVKKSRHAGETACATKASAVFAMVGQAVSPAKRACGRFFHSSSGSRLTSGDEKPAYDCGAGWRPARRLRTGAFVGPRRFFNGARLSRDRFPHPEGR